MSKKASFLEKVDRPILLITLVITLIFVFWSLIQPDVAGKVFGDMQNFIANNFGWGYLLGISSFVIALGIFAFSKYGDIVLGKDGDKPEFSTWSWLTMLFACGMGIGLVFWGVAEPMNHFANPPYGEAYTIEAAQVAMRYTFFHWGIHPWSIFAFVGLTMAYFQFRKGFPALISTTLIPIIGEDGAKGWLGKLVDILATIVTVFGISTSLGLGAMQISSGLNFAYGISSGVSTQIIIIVVMTIAFVVSAVTRIEHGMKYLSNATLLVAFAIVLFMLIVGPTRFIFNGMTETLGSYMQNIIQMIFWSDTFKTNPGWVNGWTVFYWAWWTSWGPFVGTFIARISKGRTVREFILGAVIAPALMSFIWMGVMGHSALHIDLFQNGNIAAQVAADISTAIFAVYETLPLSGILTILTSVVIATFFITSAQSATYVLAMLTSKGDLNPASGLKIGWGVVEAAVAIALLVAGGLTAVQTVAIVSAFPFMFVMFAMMASLYKAFIMEVKNQGNTTTVSDVEVLPKKQTEVI